MTISLDGALEVKELCLNKFGEQREIELNFNTPDSPDCEDCDGYNEACRYYVKLQNVWQANGTYIALALKQEK